MTMSPATRLAATLCLLSIASHFMQGQQTTNTNCTLYGNTANCTSNTTDYGAQQQRAYEQGQQVGRAIGQGLAVAMEAHSFTKGLKKYCDAHRGEEWSYRSRANGSVLSSGRCPSDEDRVSEAANEFAARHRDFVRGPANGQAMATYIQAHNFDPHERKSYERAYQELKKEGQLELYKR